MWNQINFLLEIGSEEIPAGYIPPALNTMSELFEKKLSESSIGYSKIHTFATPRRLVVAIEGLAENQKSEIIEMRGPAVDKAFDENGKATRALDGFLRGNGASIDSVEKRDTGKGVYVFIQKQTEACKSIVLLPVIITNILESMPFPKKMKWGSKQFQFPRPMRYLLTLFNDQVLEYSIDDISSSNKTRGHYVQYNKMLVVNSISSYPELLLQNGVMLDQQQRSNKIRNELKSAAAKNGAVLVEDDDLVETVTYLVEDVNIVVCSFEEKYLEIPDIVLVAEMKEHQKYFALRKQDGTLSNLFCVISNNPASDYIREGNERVIVARFDDAVFFYKEDRKKKLSERVDSLKNVLFHKDLGSIYDKVERVRKVAHLLIKAMGVDSLIAGKIDRAVTLCKADLNTAMVCEFTSLQGKIGAIYARLDGEDSEVADAIENHYRPRFHGDEKPSDIISIVLSMSEKIDNLFGAYSVGNIPKGSQDPYALRRQALAIVDLLIYNKINIDLGSIFSSLAGNYKNCKDVYKEILLFISVRAKTRFQEDGIVYDEIDAVLTTGSFDFFELYNRALSIHEFRSDESFSQMLASFKRMNNILAAFVKKNNRYKFSFNQGDLEGDYEKALAEYFLTKQADIIELSSTHEYKKIFEILIGAADVINNFFENVMVIADDLKLRDVRLGLLNEILLMFSQFIDFSKIADEK